MRLVPDFIEDSLKASANAVNDYVIQPIKNGAVKAGRDIGNFYQWLSPLKNTISVDGIFGTILKALATLPIGFVAIFITIAAVLFSIISSAPNTLGDFTGCCTELSKIGESCRAQSKVNRNTLCNIPDCRRYQDGGPTSLCAAVSNSNSSASSNSSSPSNTISNPSDVSSSNDPCADTCAEDLSGLKVTGVGHLPGSTPDDDQVFIQLGRLGGFCADDYGILVYDDQRSYEEDFQCVPHNSNPIKLNCYGWGPEEFSDTRVNIDVYPQNKNCELANLRSRISGLDQSEVVKDDNDPCPRSQVFNEKLDACVSLADEDSCDPGEDMCNGSCCTIGHCCNGGCYASCP